MTPTDMPGTAIPGRIVDDRVIPAGGDWSGVVPTGKVLRIVDLEGRQAVDFLCYSAADPSERYNAADTMKFAKTIFVTTGHGLYSGLGRRLFTIVADTCGRHDTIGGCCSAESNKLRYDVENTPNYTSVIVLNDGTNGLPAVIRSSGPDDLLDFVNPSSTVAGFGFAFPPAADDQDLPVTITTDYTLEPGKDYVKVETHVLNLGASPLLKHPIEIVDSKVDTITAPGQSTGVDLIRFTVKAQMAPIGKPAPVPTTAAPGAVGAQP